MRFFYATIAAACLWIAVSPLGTLAQTPFSETADPATQVFTRADLLEAGVDRLDGLFALADGWHAASTGGFGWHAAVGGLAPVQASAWRLFVNGQPVDVRLLGRTALDALPVHVAQIDSVAMTSAPRFVAGTFAPAGSIHIHTRTPQDGASALLAGAAGNETHEPGPYRYIERYRSVNVDRDGPTGVAEGAYGTGPLFAQVSVKGTQHYATDARVRRRLFRYFDVVEGPPVTRLLAPRAVLGLRSDAWGRHTLAASYAHLREFPFFEPLGYEIPSVRTHARLALRGDFAPGAAAGWRYRLGHDNLRTDAAPNRLDFAFGWQQQRWRGALTYDTGRLRAFGRAAHAEIGAGGTYVRSTAADAPLADPSLRTLRLHGSAQIAPAAHWTQSLSASAGVTNGAFQGAAVATAALRLSETRTLRLTLAAAQRPYAADNALWYWAAQGYDQPRTDAATLMLPGDFSASRTVTARWALAMTPTPALRLALHATLHHAAGQTLADEDFAYDPSIRILRGDSTGTGFLPSITVKSGQAGTTGQAGGSARVRLGSAIEQRFRYTYHTHASADDAFRRAYAPTPHHTASYSLRVAPGRRLVLRGRLTYRGESRWPAYRRAAAAPASPYADRVPPLWLLDLTAKKRLWDEHLQLSLSLRNTLDEPARTHPIGPVDRLTLFLGLTAEF